MTIAALSLAFVGPIMATPAEAASWKCTAKKLKNASYRGGRTAMIHLSPYKSGGRYPVTKVSDKKVVGKTKDGTPFTCTLQ
ncbi:hypothetical protein [Hoeflea poritis]|uniref:hypothetical protein n=1 Tax=Hoeflea poritis TaxID=2993659 RepID=UPI0022F0B4BB|nr:hypothetical protein [Hoeflea poritis]